MQLDLFASIGHSFPPHLDPDKVEEVRIEAEIDGDHVGAAAIGRVGNNRAVHVLRVIAREGPVLYCEPFDSWDEADAKREEILKKLQHNQRSLF